MNTSANMNYQSIPGLNRKVYYHTNTMTYINDMIFKVCQSYHITNEEFRSASRREERKEARQIICYLARKHTKLSSKMIGKIIGNRDHATVLHAVKRIKNLIETDKKIAKYIEELEQTKMREEQIEHDENALTIKDCKDLPRWQINKLQRNL